MKTIALVGQLRSELGKKATRQLRSEDQVPCVIYGGSENIHFSATHKTLKPVVYTPEFMKIEIDINGKKYTCILKDLQFHKTTDLVTHLDFLELVEGKKVNATIPLKFIGQSKGVKEGGRFVIKMSTIKLRTLPADLRENIEVDITNLEIGKNLRVEDINYPEAELLQAKRIPVAAVVTTRALKQEATAEKTGKK
jgi:large subunit ribosomal protein L25